MMTSSANYHPAAVAESVDNTPILIAYDGSEFAKAAITEAGGQIRAGRRAIVLTVSYSTEGLLFLGVGGLPGDTPTVQGMIEDAERSAEKVAEEGVGLARDAGFEAEPMVVVGTPIWDQIVQSAERLDASLIVIGSHGRSGLGQVMLGSVAAAVAQHSKRSVLIVHRPH
jgi:nucleotide-binding universal stress UspA family protein